MSVWGVGYTVFEYPWRPEEDVWGPGNLVISCDLPNMGAGSWTLVLCNKNEHFFYKKILFFFYVYNCLACMSVHMHTAFMPEKKGVGPPEPEPHMLWATMWVLGTQPRSSEKVASALKRWAIISLSTLLTF